MTCIRPRISGLPKCSELVAYLGLAIYLAVLMMHFSVYIKYSGFCFALQMKTVSDSQVAGAGALPYLLDKWDASKNPLPFNYYDIEPIILWSICLISICLVFAVFLLRRLRIVAVMLLLAFGAVFTAFCEQHVSCALYATHLNIQRAFADLYDSQSAAHKTDQKILQLYEAELSTLYLKDNGTAAYAISAKNGEPTCSTLILRLPPYPSVPHKLLYPNWGNWPDLLNILESNDLGIKVGASIPAGRVYIDLLPFAFGSAHNIDGYPTFSMIACSRFPLIYNGVGL